MNTETVRILNEIKNVGLKYNETDEIEENTIDTSENLVPFLRELACDLESGKLPPKQIESIGEFYMMFNLKAEMDTTNFNNRDVMRFFTLGWWIYTQILNESSGSSLGS